MSEPGLFDVAAAGYDRLMGRYLPTLGPVLADAAGVVAGLTALDVGCGPGGLTTVLVERLGAGRVAAVDPSAPFVAACRARLPGVDVRVGVAERLPFDDDSVDVSLASLVVGFMDDPALGVGQMRRVTRPGGRVAVSFWERDRMPLLTTFWSAVGDLGLPDGTDTTRFGRRPGELSTLLRQVGLADVVELSLGCTGTYDGLEDWWSSFTGGAGPVGAYLQSLPPGLRDRVRDRCDTLLGSPRSPFTLQAYAWCAVGTVPG